MATWRETSEPRVQVLFASGELLLDSRSCYLVIHAKRAPKTTPTVEYCIISMIMGGLRVDMEAFREREGCQESELK